MTATVMKHKRDYLYVEMDGANPAARKFYGHVVSSRGSRYPVGPATYWFNDDDFVPADYTPQYEHMSAFELKVVLHRLAVALDIPLYPAETYVDRLVTYATAAGALHRSIRDKLDDMPLR